MDCTVIIPAILPKTKKQLKEELEKASQISKLIQIDIADGKFVKNKTISVSALDNIRQKLEIHLMVSEPEKEIAKIKKADKIIFHIEAAEEPEKIIKLLKKRKINAGIAVNPETIADRVRWYLKKIDTVLIMTVYPGKQGQVFLTSQLKKIRQIRKWNKKINIEVDGGINPKTILSAKKAGANIFVVGSYLIKSRNVTKAKKELDSRLN